MTHRASSVLALCFLAACGGGSSDDAGAHADASGTDAPASDAPGTDAPAPVDGGTSDMTAPADLGVDLGIPPDSHWTVVIEDVTIPSIGCGDIGWDSAFTATPNEGDPIVFLEVGGPSAPEFPTSTCDNVTFCTFTPGTRVQMNASDLLAFLKIDVMDSDPVLYDAVGSVIIPPAQVMAAFDGSQQTESEPDMCGATMEAGFGPLHWHLEPF